MAGASALTNAWSISKGSAAYFGASSGTDSIQLTGNAALPASNTEYIHITNPGLTVTLSGLISGNSNLTRGSDAAGQVNGTLVLNNAGNTFQNFQLQSLGGAVDVQGASTLPAGATGNSITSGPLGTKTITLGSTNSGSIALENSSPVAVTLGNTLQIEDPCSFISVSGLTFAGAVTLTGSGQGSSNNHIIDFSVGANSNIAFTGQISGVDGVNLRSGSGVGGLTLSGSNTYTGATSITMGTLILGGNAPAGAAGVLGNASSPVTIGDANSAGNAAALVTNGDYTIARPITVNSTAGPATLGTIATGTSTYSGAIVLDNSAMLSAPAGGSAIFTGPITGTSGITAAAAAGGNVSLAATAANQDRYSGATTVASGQLTLDYGLMTPSGGTVGGMLPDSPVVLSGGTLAFKGNAAAAVNETLLSTQVAAPGSAVVVSPVNGQALEIGLGSITRSGGVLDLPVSSATFTTTNPNSNGILGGYLTVNGYQGWAANNGSNTIAALSSYNTDDYSSPGNNVDVTNFALTPSGTVNSLRFNQATGGTLALGGELMLASGGILVTPNVGPHNVAISGGVLTASGTTSTNALADVVVVQGNTAAPFDDRREYHQQRHGIHRPHQGRSRGVGLDRLEHLHRSDQRQRRHVANGRRHAGPRHPAGGQHCQQRHGHRQSQRQPELRRHDQRRRQRGQGRHGHPHVDHEQHLRRGHDDRPGHVEAPGRHPAAGGRGRPIRLDASNRTSLSLTSSNVTAWNDLSGNGNNFTLDSAAAAAPTLANNVNGKVSVHFNAASGTNRTDLVSTNPVNVQTVFIVDTPLTFATGDTGIWGWQNNDEGLRGSGNSWFIPGNGNDFVNASGSFIEINGSRRSPAATQASPRASRRCWWPTGPTAWTAARACSMRSAATRRWPATTAGSPATFPR